MKEYSQLFWKSSFNIFQRMIRWMDCKEIVILVRQGQIAVDEQMMSLMLLLKPGFMCS